MRQNCGLKTARQASRKFWVLQCAFPNSKCPPASLMQGGCCAQISNNIRRELALPKFNVGFRHTCEATIGMAMPETTMNKYRKTVLGHHYVGLARKVFAMQSKSKA